jgi:3-deoxy-D-manno-octulosonate 8-phosphate phosphatase (KDO 8-P phosphatase)
MKQEVDMVTRAGGGQGALREVADLVLAARGEMEKIIRG